MDARKPQHVREISPSGSAQAHRLLKFDHVQPDREQISRLVGLKAGRDGHRRWFELIDRQLVDLMRIMRPRAVLRIDAVATLTAARLTLESGAVYEGDLQHAFEHAQLVATFIVTIGSAAERLGRRWIRFGEVMAGTIADAIASEAAEAAAQCVQDEVRAWAQGQGLDITPRLSPGYCGLHVDQQRTLFASLPAREINVRLTPSCLMLPLKSVSGLIGIGPAEKVSPTAYPCARCDAPACAQRRAPFAAT